VGRDGDKAEAEGAEPLAEWEQELLAGATATASAQPGTPEADIQTEPKITEG
jgi:small subunit ribosomal protein S2